VQREFEAQLAAAREAARLVRQEISTRAAAPETSGAADRHMSLPKRVWDDLGLTAPPQKKQPAAAAGAAPEATPAAVVDANFLLRPTTTWQGALERLGIRTSDLGELAQPDAHCMAIHRLLEPSGR
jgi:hypothetical protein